MPDIFLSYASPDDESVPGCRKFVTDLHEYLEKVGRQKYGRRLEIWRDTKQLTAGVQWEKNLFEKLRASWLFLPIFSPSWIHSEFCKREWDVFWKGIQDELKVENQTRIVPVSFELTDDQYADMISEQRRLQIAHRFKRIMTSPTFVEVADRLVAHVVELLQARDARTPAAVVFDNNSRPGADSMLAAPPAETFEPYFDAVPSYFQDREAEQEKIKKFLQDPSRRLLRVVGASGYGKTTLVYSVLNSLRSPENQRIRVRHIITLNAAQPGGVSVSTLVSELEKIDPNVREGRHDNIEIRLISILEHFNRRDRVVVFIDEFELLVDGATRKTAPDAANLLSIILQRVSSPLKVILTTVLEPSDLAAIVPALQDRLLVDRLVSPYGENLLRACDQQGDIGLRDESQEVLSRACENLGWSPRELEFLYSHLVVHPSLTLREVLDNEELQHGNAVEFFAGKIFNRLDAKSRLVAQALAIYDRQIEPEGIRYLLDLYGFTDDPVPSLNQLVDRRLARRSGTVYYFHVYNGNTC